MSRASNSVFTRVLIGAAAAFGVLVSATDAQAIELGAGLIVGGGGNFISKPDPFPNGLSPNPGFGGATYGGGLAVDLRVLPFFGIEIDALLKHGEGTGSYSINGFNVDTTIGGSSFHLPLLLKGVLPSPLVAPFVVFGPEYVNPSYEAPETKPALPPGTVSQWADSYWMLTFGVGMEVKLPLPIVDLRIPVSLRGSVNPGASSKAEDRTRPVPLTYNAEWQYSITLNAGAQIYF